MHRRSKSPLATHFPIFELNRVASHNAYGVLKLTPRPDRLDQFFLVHLASPFDPHLLSDVIKLRSAPPVERGIRIPGSLGGTVRGFAILVPLFIHGAGRDLLRLAITLAMVLDALFDVLVLSLVFIGPFGHLEVLAAVRIRGFLTLKERLPAVDPHFGAGDVTRLLRTEE